MPQMQEQEGGAATERVLRKNRQEIVIGRPRIEAITLAEWQNDGAKLENGPQLTGICDRLISRPSREVQAVQ